MVKVTLTMLTQEADRLGVKLDHDGKAWLVMSKTADRPDGNFTATNFDSLEHVAAYLLGHHHAKHGFDRYMPYLATAPTPAGGEEK